MRRTFTLICLPFIIANFLQAQVSQNMNLLSVWKDDTLPDRSGSVYNDLWGFAFGEREYAILGSAKYTHFIDVTDPVNPQEVARFEEHTLSLWRDYKTYGHYSYGMAQENNPSDPSGMQIFYHGYLPDSIVKVYDSNALFTTAHNIFIDEANGKLYVAGSNVRGNGLLVLDLTVDPENPTIVGNVGLPGGYVHDVYVRNNIAYCSHGNSGLYIYDFTNPASPVLIGSLSSYPQQGYNHSSWVTDDGNFLVFADETHGRPLRLLDITDLSDLTILSTFQSQLLAPASTNSIPHNPIIRGDYVFISYYHDGIQVYDISDVIAPKKVAYYDTDTFFTTYSGYEGAWGVYPFLPSHNILGSDQINGLFILEFDGLNPSPLPSSQLSPNLPQDELQLVKKGNQSDLAFKVDPNIFPTNTLQLFPNPAPPNGNIHLRINHSKEENVEISVFDISGKLVWKKRNIRGNISLPGLNPGIYQIVASGSNLFARKRLMVRD